MKIEVINGIRIITPDNKMWLCDESQKVISDKVYLGVNANENDWHDITEEEYEEKQKEVNESEEANSERHNTNVDF
jgi:hypothetical protein